jgi:hypothetical protein
MVAFIPTCSCERETASHTFVSDGISTIGVGNVSGTGDSVTCGIGVSVNVGKLVAVGDGSSVSVGDRVAVGGMGVAEAGAAVGLALSVVEGVERSGVVVESEI